MVQNFKKLDIIAEGDNTCKTTNMNWIWLSYLLALYMLWSWKTMGDDENHKSLLSNWLSFQSYFRIGYIV